MKNFLLSAGLFLAVTSSLLAQSRMSIAPSYWFTYNPYSYQISQTFNGSTTQTLASGHGIVSSVGLMARYYFTPQWDISAGVFYYRNADHIKSPQGPYGEYTPFISKGWLFPILVNHRLTDSRLSPYFSVGAILAKSKTFTERPITTDGVVGIGINYRINSGLSILLQPTASYSFYRPASDAFYTFSQYTSYSFGLQTQLIWHF
ncbi:hypothetical protein [Spirosoma aerolatum]|uniref:hypothetical protein n=1 Tax=Spirosoma aerolatum TaxID=1211326 RepID=UPI0009AD46AA|nr:hypothetical protein [Spirosoma aerolatum]